jgi:nucleoside-triphosphatase THEP1
MEHTPIKKFEKIITEVNHSQTTVITKITDFRNKSVVYEVRDSRQKVLFKNLEDARKHLNNLTQSGENKSQASLSIA